MTTGVGERQSGSHRGAEPTPSEALRLYESMVLIRRVEERLRDDSAAGKLPYREPAPMSPRYAAHNAQLTRTHARTPAPPRTLETASIAAGGRFPYVSLSVRGSVSRAAMVPGGGDGGHVVACFMCWR
jgi:hypothetical protein